MRVALLATSYPRFEADSAGCFVEGFARCLVSLGHEVTVLCPEPRRPSGRRHIPGIRVLEIPYARPRAVQRTFYGGGVPENVAQQPLLSLGLPAFTLALDRALAARRGDFDGFVSHWALPSGLVASRHARGLPHVAVLHSADVHALSVLPAGGALARAVCRGASGLWFVSAALERRFAALAGPLPPRLDIHVGPMGIDAAPPSADRAALRAALGIDGFSALSLGRLAPIKGIEDAILAARSLEDVSLLIAGEGGERTRLEALAHGSRVRFEGQVAGARKAALLAAADVFVFPSRIGAGGRQEGAPVAIIEAMAAGLPVIATRSGGVPELVEDGREGLLVPPGDAPALARALARFRDDEALRRRLGEAARLRAASYLWEAQRPRLASLLASR